MNHEPSKLQSALLSTAMTATHTHPMAMDVYLMLSAEHDGKDVPLVHAKHGVVDLQCYPLAPVASGCFALSLLACLGLKSWRLKSGRTP